MKNVIERKWSIPWGIMEYVEEIQRLMRICDAKVTHIYREGNKLADHLANYSLDVGPIE